jgi:hypothetical protein
MGCAGLPTKLDDYGIAVDWPVATAQKGKAREARLPAGLIGFALLCASTCSPSLEGARVRLQQSKAKQTAQS